MKTNSIEKLVNRIFNRAGIVKGDFTTAAKVFLVFTFITGVLYPLLITGTAALFFSHQSEGSIIYRNGEPVGSELIAQKFTGSQYFHSRPSSIDYNPMPSGGSNLSLSDKRLIEMIKEREKAFIEKNLLPRETRVPPEMLTSSASGVDPHISLEAALMQVDRIANVRGFGEDGKKRLILLIYELEEKQTGEIPGWSRINVLNLNLKLDKLSQQYE